MQIIRNGSKYTEFIFEREEDLENEIVMHSRSVFGESTIYIDAKKKIDAKAIGGAVPDGFLFDLSDPEAPEFYIVEVELKSHDFYRHIFPQITKYFAFFKNNKSMNKLIEEIFCIINKNEELKRDFKKFLGGRETYKFLKDTIENKQNILLLLDGEKDEFPEMIETYTDTWGKMVKKIIFRKFVSGKDFIYVIDPDFSSVEYPPGEGGKTYSEEYHLDGVEETVKDIYYSLKSELMKIDNNIMLNPQRYYISVISGKNVAYFEFGKKKVRLTVLFPENEVRKIVKNHHIISLSEGVQKFYGKSCCAIMIEKREHLDEVVDVLKRLILKKLAGIDKKGNKKEKQIKEYSEEGHLLVADTGIRELYEKLKTNVLSIGNEIKVSPKKLYIAFVAKRNFIDVEIRKKELKVYLNLKKGELSDPEGLTRDISQVGHWGNGDYALYINGDKDLDYILSLIKQSYKKNSA